MRMTVAMVTMTATTPRRWRPVSIGSSRAHLRLVSTSRGRESQGGRQAGLVRVNRGSHPHAAFAPTLPQSLRQVGLSLAPNLLPRPRRATGSNPW